MSIEEHRQILREVEQDFDYWFMGSLLEFITSLQTILHEDGVLQKDLAKRLRVTEPVVSDALKPGNSNLTLKRMNRMAEAVGATVHIHVDRRRFNGRWVRTNDPAGDRRSGRHDCHTPLPRSKDRHSKELLVSLGVYPWRHHSVAQKSGR